MKVRVVAASGPFGREPFDAGVEILEAAGFTVDFEEHIFERDRYLAGSDERRLGALRSAMASPEVDVIWAARGGFGATRIVNRVAVDAVAKAHKRLVGFSDVTALHALWARAGLESIHGANITTLSQWSGDARNELFEWVRDGRASVTLEGRVLASGGAVRGPLRGGNLAVLAAMVGTGGLPDLSGAVVLLEDIGEHPYRLDRMATQLIEAGVLEGVAAVVLGQMSGCSAGESADYDAYDVLGERFATLGCPVAAGFALGHDADSRAVVLGADAALVDGRLTVARK